MGNLDNYLSIANAQLPGVEQRLNSGASEEKLNALALQADCELPEDFVRLYRRFDGEDRTKSVCFFAGLEFLPLAHILSDLSFFQSAETELTAMGTRAIQEMPMCQLKWIPFAYDCSRAWLAMDLSPAEGGTVGQIITIDYDCDQCYLLADSMEDLLGKMTMWFQKGILSVNTEQEQPFIIERSGHLFNSLEELTAPETDGAEQEIPLPAGYWQERYQQPHVPLSRLVKEKSLLIQKQSLDCEIFAYMENLKELILHHCHLQNMSAIARIPQLKKLIFVDCTLEGGQLSDLSAAPNLKELGVHLMSAAGLTELKSLKTLKGLRMRNVTDFAIEELASFTKLQDLSIESMEFHDGTFIGELKNLKILELHTHALHDLSFLANLTKLAEFSLSRPADNEAGLTAVHTLTKLKSFLYPVRDLSVYKGHPTLEHVGMSLDVTQGFEAFEGSKVQGFTVFGEITQERLEEIRNQMEKYVKIYSYAIRRQQL